MVFSVDVFGEASHVPLVQISRHRVTGFIGDVGHPGAAVIKVVNVAVGTAPAQFATLQLVDQRFFTVNAIRIKVFVLLYDNMYQQLSNTCPVQKNVLCMWYTIHSRTRSFYGMRRQPRGTDFGSFQWHCFCWSFLTKYSTHLHNL